MVGSEYDNTLIRDCFIHDTEADGIFLRNVKNVVIYNCTFANIGGMAAVRGSVEGGTDDVLVLDNLIENVQQNGISFPQRESLDHTKLQIVGNTIVNSGLGERNGLAHPLYIQSTDAFIVMNKVAGSRDGNGISLRSSGQVSCNDVSGTSGAGKPAIRYFSDHKTGPSDRLEISHNTIHDSIVDLYSPAPRYNGETGDGHVVKQFAIYGNSFFDSLGTVDEQHIEVACDYGIEPFSLTIDANMLC